MSFAYRLEVPIFDFQKTQPTGLSEQEQTIIHNFVFQMVGIWDRLTLLPDRFPQHGRSGRTALRGDAIRWIFGSELCVWQVWRG